MGKRWGLDIGDRLSRPRGLAMYVFIRPQGSGSDSTTVTELLCRRKAPTIAR